LGIVCGVSRIRIKADKKDRFEITKLLMAQADIERRFFGTIQRCSDEDGYPVIPDRIKVIKASLWLMAGHQDELGVAAG
jgi:hypothetical protein